MVRLLSAHYPEMLVISRWSLLAHRKHAVAANLHLFPQEEKDGCAPVANTVLCDVLSEPFANIYVEALSISNGATRDDDDEPGEAAKATVCVKRWGERLWCEHLRWAQGREPSLAPAISWPASQQKAEAKVKQAWVDAAIKSLKRYPTFVQQGMSAHWPSLCPARPKQRRSIDETQLPGEFQNIVLSHKRRVGKGLGPPDNSPTMRTPGTGGGGALPHSMCSVPCQGCVGARHLLHVEQPVWKKKKEANTSRATVWLFAEELLNRATPSEGMVSF